MELNELQKELQSVCQLHVMDYADGLARHPEHSNKQEWEIREYLKHHVEVPFYPKHLKKAMIEIGFYWFESCKLKYRKI